VSVEDEARHSGADRTKSGSGLPELRLEVVPPLFAAIIRLIEKLPQPAYKRGVLARDSPPSGRSRHWSMGHLFPRWSPRL